ncbi:MULTISPECIES: protein kinase domain-containing protein [unclassified Streptomyces]|uniref:serine/threonine-protein kinase n=1 Tax=unclassified Streptomyces TaxID=2593676 RepID=UPI0004C6AA70|nr:MULTISPECIES: serine/threonine-protein kinase [unclassified Streptomyces]
MQPLRATDPRHIGPYTTTHRLGAGGMGEVYLAESRTGLRLAVKVVRAEHAEDRTFRARFRHEVRAAQTVGGADTYTARVVDADTEAERPWMATEFVPGPNVRDAVLDHGALPGPAVRILAAALGEALAAIHAKGLVHRDLKPSNILLGPDGPRVIDFGIVRALEATSLTRTGAVVGSVGYVSPEQIRNGGQVGPPSDVFSLGAVIAYAAAGREPFGEGQDSVVLLRILTRDFDLSGVPEDIRPLVTACLREDPLERPEPAEVVASAGFTPDTLRTAVRPGWYGPAARPRPTPYDRPSGVEYLAPETPTRPTPTDSATVATPVGSAAPSIPTGSVTGAPTGSTDLATPAGSTAPATPTDSAAVATPVGSAAPSIPMGSVTGAPAGSTDLATPVGSAAPSIPTGSATGAPAGSTDLATPAGSTAPATPADSATAATPVGSAAPSIPTGSATGAPTGSTDLATPADSAAPATPVGSVTPGTPVGVPTAGRSLGPVAPGRRRLLKALAGGAVGVAGVGAGGWLWEYGFRTESSGGSDRSPSPSAHRANGAAVLRWQYDLGGIGGLDGACCALSPDGSVVYAGTSGGVLHAISRDGSKRWKVRLGDDVSTPVATRDAVYCVVGLHSEDTRRLTAVSPSGSPLWTRTLGDQRYAVPVLLGQDVLVSVGGTDTGGLRRYASDGSESWTVKTPAGPTGTPLVSAGTVWTGSYGDVLLALDARDGSRKWQVSGGTDVTALALAGSTLFTDSAAELQGFRVTDGRRLWHKEDDGGSLAGGSRTLAVGTEQGGLYAVRAADGSRAWRYGFEGGQAAPRAVVAGDTVYARAGEKVCALDLNGKKRWNADLGRDAGDDQHTPVVRGDRLYVPSGTGIAAVDVSA